MQNSNYQRFLEYKRLYKEHKYNQAYKIIKELYQLESNDRCIILEYGKMLVIQKDYNKARNYFESLLNTSSRSYAMLELGRLEVTEGNYAKARDYFESLLNTSSRNYAKLELGRLEVVEGNYVKARDYFESLLNTSSRNYALQELKKLEIQTIFCQNINPSNDDSIISQALTRIYSSNISIDDIKNLNLEKREIDILLIAYYEKNFKKICPKFVKNLIKQYQNDIEIKEILIQLYNRVCSTKKLFDITVYERVLKTKVNLNKIQSMDINLVDEVPSNDNHVLNSNAKINSTPTVKISQQKKKETKQFHIIKREGIKVTPRYQASSSQQVNISSTPPKVNIPNTPPKVEISSLGKEFKDEFLEIRKYLYIKMQDNDSRKDTIKAWDILDQLDELPCTTENLTKFLNLLQRCQIDVKEAKKKKIYGK